MKPLAWARLNADGILLAVVCLAGALDVFHPNSTELARALGYVPPTFYFWSICYGTAGVLLLGSFLGPARFRLPLELAGRLTLCVGFLIQVWRTGVILGWSTQEMVINYAVGFVLLVAAISRVSMLLDRRGVVVLIGRSEGS